MADYVINRITTDWPGKSLRNEDREYQVDGCLLYQFQRAVSISADKQEIPKTPDHAPSRTFYLYTVNVLSATRMLLHRCYKVTMWFSPLPRSLHTTETEPLAFLVCPLFPQSIANLIERRQFETKENR